MPRPKPPRRRQLAALNWRLTPSRLQPHGLTGLVSVAIGAHLIFRHSLAGDLRPYSLGASTERLEMNNAPIQVIAYAIATCLNSIAGYRIAPAAPPTSRPIFRRCAVLQMCLSYFILRFMPHATILLDHSDNLQHSMWVLDAFVTTVSVACTLSFLEAAVDLSQTSLVLGHAIAVGVLGILLLSVYPVQLSLQGEEWWTCIQHRYHMQAAGMVAYIYIPATVSFSLTLFGATLYQRKILSANEFGLMSLLVIVGCLLAAVLSQEVHIPDVSTQRIYLPCEDPPAGSFEDRVLQALDFSRYARAILTRCFGIKFGSESG